jgi:hypothetical protein
MHMGEAGWLAGKSWWVGNGAGRGGGYDMD